MTNEEAIMILKAMIDDMILVFDRDRKKALNMAIKALEQPEIVQCKDCKYMRRDVIFDQCWCNRSSRVSPIDDDEYCSRADRRKE